MKPGPIALPYGAPPLTGTTSAAMPEAPAPSLPSMPVQRAQLPPMGGPGRISPFNPPDIRDYRGNQVQDTGDFQRDQSIRGAFTDEAGNFKPKRDKWDILKNVALGFMQGAQANPQNTLMGGIGGAATGGIISAVNPLVGKEYQFAMTQQPGIDAEEEKRRRNADRARNERMDAAKLRGLEADAEMTEVRAKNFPEQVAAERDLRAKQLETAEAARLKALAPAKVPQNMRLGTNLESGERDYYDVNNPEERARYRPYISADEKLDLDIDPDSQLSSAEMADASFEKRGGVGYVLAQQAPDIRQILQEGTVTENGETRDARPNEVMRAQQILEAAVAKQKAYDLRYTKDFISSKVRGAQKGGASTPKSSPASSASGTKIKLSEAKKLLNK